jgi:nitroreductase
LAPDRRSLLLGGGAALVLGGLAFRAWDRGVWSGGKGPAYAPWSDLEASAADPLTRTLRAAILAANPHDTQPWLFQIKDDSITLFADRARHLGSFDPFRREMHLGLGAALENLALAAEASGFLASIMPVEGRLTLSPDSAPTPAARIVLRPTPAVRGALFSAIARRHTNRGPYRPDQPVGAETLHRLTGLVSDDTVRAIFVTDKAARSELGALIIAATTRIVGDPQMSADSARWFRTGRREIAAHRDGVTVDTSGASPFLTAMSKMLPDLNAKSADHYWLASTRDTEVPTAPVLGILLVRDRLDMFAAIAAGRAWQRLHLALTAAGLAAQPLNQPVECVDRSAMRGDADDMAPAINKFTGVPGWEPTFMFRLGVADSAAGPSPRRPLAAVLMADG